MCVYVYVYVYVSNIGYLSRTHLKPQSHEISFANNIFPSYSIILKFCTDHDSETSALCAKFQNDWTAQTDVMDEWDCQIWV